MYLVRSLPLLAASGPKTSTSRPRIQLVEIMPSEMMPGSPCFFAYASSSWIVGGCVTIRPVSCCTVSWMSTYQRMRSRVMSRGARRNSMPVDGFTSGPLLIREDHGVAVGDERRTVARGEVDLHHDVLAALL